MMIFLFAHVNDQLDPPRETRGAPRCQRDTDGEAALNLYPRDTTTLVEIIVLLKKHKLSEYKAI